MYARDYETKGMVLIELENIGVINATSENFNIAASDMAENEQFLKAIKAISGVFCLVPDELDIPF